MFHQPPQKGHTMIEVKLSFASQAELLAFFAGAKPLVSADEKAAVAAISVDKAVKPGKPQPAAPVTTPTATEAPAATTETVAESPSSPKATGPTTSTSSSPAPDASAAVEYPVLKKAVFALASKSNPAAKALVEKYGVRTFQDLDPARWGEALADVNAELAKLG